MKVIRINNFKQYRAWLNRMIRSGYRIMKSESDGAVLERPFDKIRVVLEATK